MNKVKTAEDIEKMLEKSGNWILATADGDSPRVRFMEPVHVFEGRLCFLTSRRKKLARQIDANPNVEILALTRPDQWLRVTAEAYADGPAVGQNVVSRRPPGVQGRTPGGRSGHGGVLFKKRDRCIGRFRRPCRTVLFLKRR